MDKMINVMKDNLNIITSKTTSTSQKLNACLKLRLYAPTHHYVPHRDNLIEKNKKELMLRETLFDNNKWSALQARINYEQDKKNQKKLRRINKDLEKENQRSHQQENENRCFDEELKQNLSEIYTKNLLENTNLSHESCGDVNMNLLAQRINDLRYNEGET